MDMTWKRLRSLPGQATEQEPGEEEDGMRLAAQDVAEFTCCQRGYFINGADIECDKAKVRGCT